MKKLGTMGSMGCGFLVIWTVTMLLSVALLVGALIVAIHFTQKFW